MRASRTRSLCASSTACVCAQMQRFRCVCRRNTQNSARACCRRRCRRSTNAGDVAHNGAKRIYNIFQLAYAGRALIVSSSRTATTTTTTTTLHNGADDYHRIYATQTHTHTRTRTHYSECIIQLYILLRKMQISNAASHVRAWPNWRRSDAALRVLRRK